MSSPVEIRIHGRGGQGNVAAAYLLAAAAIKAGFEAHAFPAFGAERRGAPVTAFVRIRHAPIRRRAEVEHPDFLIVLDATLLNLEDTLGGLAPDGGIVVNANGPDAVSADIRRRYRVATLPASRIAEATIGRKVPNVPLIAALVGLTEILPAEALADAIADRFDVETAAGNKKAAELARAEIVQGAWRGGLRLREGTDASRH